MGRDPELESIANISGWKACETWNGNMPLERWIAACTKRNIWCYWRERARKREEQADLGWFLESIAARPTPDDVAELDQPQLQLLCEYHLEGWCLDVVAKRKGMSKKQAREAIHDAEVRLLYREVLADA